jgi:hypothetical protein
MSSTYLDSNIRADLDSNADLILHPHFFYVGYHLESGTLKSFIIYFDHPHDSFDFKDYDIEKKIVILDTDSNKTKQTLEQIARDLISEAERLMK